MDGWRLDGWWMAIETCPPSLSVLTLFSSFCLPRRQKRAELLLLLLRQRVQPALPPGQSRCYRVLVPGKLEKHRLGFKVRRSFALVATWGQLKTLFRAPGAQTFVPYSSASDVWDWLFTHIWRHDIFQMQMSHISWYQAMLIYEPVEIAHYS